VTSRAIRGRIRSTDLAAVHAGIAGRIDRERACRDGLTELPVDHIVSIVDGVFSDQNGMIAMKSRWAAVLGIGLLITTLRAANGPERAEPGPQAPVVSKVDQAGRSEDERAIRASVEAFARAFQNGDARAVAAMFAEDGEPSTPRVARSRVARPSKSTTRHGSRTSPAISWRSPSSPSSSSRRGSRGELAVHESYPQTAGLPSRAVTRLST
jgi:hypothetical protein